MYIRLAVSVYPTSEGIEWPQIQLSEMIHRKRCVRQLSALRWTRDSIALRGVTGHHAAECKSEKEHDSEPTGDWVYWGARLGRDPTKPKRVIRLSKQQHERCPHCGLRFKTEDVLEVHHQDGHHTNNDPTNLVLLHAHCHDVAHSKRCQ